MSEEQPSFEHVPVLAREAIAALRIRPAGFYVDGTFGRGGHSRRLLQALGGGGRLLALDRDPEAVAAGQRMAKAWGDARFEIAHARFSELEALLAARGIAGIDGLLLDLGISSPQVDDASRGFSFMGDGPLDMRMDPTQGMSAKEWLMSASEQDIAEVLKRYGDERFAVPIAKTVVARRDEAGSAAFQTTRQLADVVAGVVRRAADVPDSQRRVQTALAGAADVGQIDGGSSDVPRAGGPVRAVRNGPATSNVTPRPSVPRWDEKYRREPSGLKAGPQISLAS